LEVRNLGKPAWVAAWSAAKAQIQIDRPISLNKIMENHTESELKESTQKLLHDLRQVVQDGEEVLRAGAHELGEKGVAARAKLAAALDSAKETARKLQEKTIASAKATDKVIREHPYQSIGIAFGIGIVVGLLINRK
jgi:ElaB/YqjD/DUF883 family membrane-anchored ribosome-binding protein